MARIHVEKNVVTGVETQIPYTPQEEAAADAQDAILNAEAARRTTLTGDATVTDILNRLKTADAAQIRTYVTNNVTDLASARVMLGHILVLLARLN